MTSDEPRSDFDLEILDPEIAEREVELEDLIPPPVPAERNSRLPKILRTNPVATWLEDAWDGLTDTTHDAVARGRRAARETNNQQWREYDAKTKYRRKDD